ncbi:MAG TPA: VOC family protein [Chthoniobacterales bacterium]|jgi:catechol 2,3-dioxygenase-like lactoylglutathione lyase family enzyme|nr:VOC family protein [Chthoniobacterales bacterium]
MSTRIFDHIDLRVRNRQKAQAFYSQILPAIGLRVDKSGEKWGLFEAEGSLAVDFFGFTEEAGHEPNGNRIAFWAGSREAVNKVAEIVRNAGAKNVEGPELCVEYSPGYYAVFFEDPDGNKLEVCFRESATAAE